ncbi:lipopolysaccharide heptosyltransferase I [Helicobacter pylori]|uniref:lipopolysaccharide heptosyltransferase I n=1 Tax=Helicobacter pylori TaxID=210 RepID=UPI000EB3B4A6|nr:lipopolysaccharide heptosyltransferase I [Helicobacter pylori]BDO44278.1 Lipopolysaccharide heptosyltransferase RfaC [Helicobacter pylori]BDO45884.1 Lipopolysaccharide heptosyltransferase RfaC [Helicobacter pylori]GHQ42726.1 lipopolysaccharide heptosyltransferase I [Helicobacter pylori]GHR46037.1 lipopolysaccharide heptosyltransferase I [Helicobacter pylori]GHS21900.1 lipopolysaccharide heptosyltransferase I [Helicobacter pylori]
MKIAIVRLSALGDIIVSAVFLALIKERFTNAQIEWFVDERFGAILEHSPYIDKLHPIALKSTLTTFNPLKIFKLFKSLRAYEYDIVIDMQGLIKSALITQMLKAPKKVGFDYASAREGLSAFFYSQKVSIAYNESILKRNFTLLSHALNLPKKEISEGLSSRSKVFSYQDSPKIDALNLNKNKPKILFVLETSKINKTYPIERFKELALALENFQICLLWHASEDKATALYGALKNQRDVLLLPKLTLNEVKALLFKMDLIIGGDTGITHLAWALQKPSITLYGNTPMERFKLESPINVSLTGNSNANYHKKDFSIQNIDPKKIKECVLNILKEKE